MATCHFPPLKGLPMVQAAAPDRQQKLGQEQNSLEKEVEAGFERPPSWVSILRDVVVADFTVEIVPQFVGKLGLIESVPMVDQEGRS